MLSNVICRSVVHKVAQNSDSNMLSIAYLWGPHSTIIIRPAPGLVDSEHPLLYRPLTWNECLKGKTKNIHGTLELFKLGDHLAMLSN